MPTPKSKREVVLQSTFSAGTVATLSLGVDAAFTTPRGTTTVNLFEDSSAGTTNEATEYQMTFGTTSSSQIGVITFSFTGGGDNPASGLVVNKTSAVSTIDPIPRTTTVTPITSPDASFSRSWQQAALDAGATQLVNQVGGVSIRVKAASGNRVTQTVTSASTAQLIVSYTFNAANGNEVMTGTVTFTASSVASAGYSLGAATVVDNPSTVRR